MIRETVASIGRHLAALRTQALARPDGEWRLERRGRTRIWRGYDREIWIEPQGFGRDWTVTQRVDGRSARIYRGTDPFDYAAEYMGDLMRRETGGRMRTPVVGVDGHGRPIAGRAD